MPMTDAARALQRGYRGPLPCMSPMDTIRTAADCDAHTELSTARREWPGFVAAEPRIKRIMQSDHAISFIEAYVLAMGTA